MKKKYLKFLTIVSIFGIILSYNFNLYNSVTIVNSSIVYNTSNKVNGNIITYYNHSTDSHTFSEIKDSYFASKSSVDYSVTSPYKSEPVYTGPNYYEGELNDTTINDTLKTLNFYRWLSGLTPVTVNYDKMSRNQKGALIQAVNEEMTHFPTKPDDMSEEFYKSAYAGTGAGYDDDASENYTGNVSWGTNETMVDSIAGYVSDIYNVGAGVGHRSSMLDPFAQRTSFGFAGLGSYTYGTSNWSKGFYTAVSNYRKYDKYYSLINPGNNEDFYPYPTSGLFPVEVTPARGRGSYVLSWSVRLMNDISFDSNNTTIDLINNGTTYTVPTSDILVSSKTLSWKLPSELLDKIVAGNNNFLPGEVVDVRVNNLTNSSSNVVNLEYSVQFISIDAVDLVTIDLLLNQHTGNAAWVIPDNNGNFNLEGRETTYGFRITPEDALVTKFTISVLDPSVLSVDESNKKIIINNGGKTTVTLKEETSGKTFEYTLTGDYIIPEINFDNESIVLKKNSTLQLSKSIDPITTTPKSESYVSSNSNVVSVSSTGLVTAKETGTSIITYTASFNGGNVTKKITVTVSDSDTTIKGDVNGDGKIELSDILIELKIFFNSITPTNEQKSAADVNGDGVINLTDILTLLKLFFNK